MSPEIAATLWVALGGGLGGILRYAIERAVTRFTGKGFPWGTLLVNVAGSFLIGYVGFPALAEVSTGSAAPDLRFLVAVGVFGGFTTFSCFSLEVLDLIRAGAIVRAGAYVLGSVTLGLAAAALGLILGSTAILAQTGG